MTSGYLLPCALWGVLIRLPLAAAEEIANEHLVAATDSDSGCSLAPGQDDFFRCDAKTHFVGRTGNDGSCPTWTSCCDRFWCWKDGPSGESGTDGGGSSTNIAGMFPLLVIGCCCCGAVCICIAAVVMMFIQPARRPPPRVANPSVPYAASSLPDAASSMPQPTMPQPTMPYAGAVQMRSMPQPTVPFAAERAQIQTGGPEGCGAGSQIQADRVD